MARLLIEEYPLVIIPSLANKIGLNQAIFLQQVHYWIEQGRNIEDGRSWVYNTYEEWQKRFPFWSVRTLKRIVNELETIGLIISATKYNKRNLNQKKWYTIDYDKFNAIMGDEIINALSLRNSSNKDNKVTDENNLPVEKKDNLLQETAEKGREILKNKGDIEESKITFMSTCPDPLSQPVTLDDANLSPSIAPTCPDGECQNDTLDSDKIVIPTYITENTTEIITDNTTETSSKDSLPLTPSKSEDEDDEADEANENGELNKSNLEFQRLFKLFEKMHHTPNANETRKLHLIFEAQGDKAVEYAILCSEKAKSPIGYIVSVLKDKSVFSVFNNGGETNDGSKNFNGKTGENRYPSGFRKHEKRARDTDCLPESEEESKFNNFHW